MATTGNKNKRNWRRGPNVPEFGFRFYPFVIVSFVLFYGWQERGSAAQAFVGTPDWFVPRHTNLNPRFRFRFHLSCIHHNRCDNDTDNDTDTDTDTTISILSTPDAKLLAEDSKEKMLGSLSRAGLWDMDSQQSSSEGLLLLAGDFVDRPEAFSSLLIKDFGVPVLQAHLTRAIVMAAIRERTSSSSSSAATTTNDRNDEASKNDIPAASTNDDSPNVKPSTVDPIRNTASNDWNGAVDTDKDTDTDTDTDTPVVSTDDGSSVVAVAVATSTPKPYNAKEFESTIVNERARRRKRSVDNYNYGLSKDYATRYPGLASELDDFYNFMTQPTTYSQESPIRDATAKVYMNHAKLFLGWCVQNVQTEDEDNDNDNDNDGNGDNDDSANTTTNKKNTNTNRRIKNDGLSIFAVLPTKEKESANNIIRFVVWIRTRDISVSYEANILRGLIKLLKFRFAKESNSDPLDGKNTFDDIPIIKEVRKLHRDANQRQRLAPRSSDESKKWITWHEYLSVTQHTKNEAMELIRKYQELPKSKRKFAKGDTDRLYSLEQTRVAEAYQRYLILAILASIPDRQRTIRELEVGRTLRKDTELGCWVVKHGPGDYKTGKHYGERPAMQLAAELTPSIDDFLERWRPALKPSTNLLLVQSKTGKPMTSNSIFKRVVRCCFKHTGKSVNPHLLRDIIVTHVRETDASEKELEALALYMGHSIQMQRTSYDRRTLSSKVAPAISLMKSVNKMEGS